MMRDRSPIWIGLADLLLCVVCVVIAAVAPTTLRWMASSRRRNISSPRIGTFS